MNTDKDWIARCRRLSTVKRVLVYSVAGFVLVTLAMDPSDRVVAAGVVTVVILLVTVIVTVYMLIDIFGLGED